MMILAAIGLVYVIASVSGLACLWIWINTPMEWEPGLNADRSV